MPNRLAIRLRVRRLDRPVCSWHRRQAPAFRVRSTIRPPADIHIEGGVGFWFPGAQMTVSSESLGIVGTAAERTINLVSDLGLTNQRFSELHLVLKPSKTSKFRLQYIPINYTQSATIKRTIIFNGQRYDVGLPVNSTLGWKAYRFGYEYDFVVTNRGSFKPSHRCPCGARQPDHARVRGPGRRFQPSAASAESIVPNISITATGFAAGQADQRQQRPLHRRRHLRHHQLHERLRRPDRLPVLTSIA